MREEDLDPAEAERVHDLLEAADVPALAARSPIAGPGADMYHYEIVVVQGNHADRVVVDGSKVPEELHPLTTLLEQRAEGHAQDSRARNGEGHSRREGR